MFVRNLVTIIVLLAATGCASTPKVNYIQHHDPIMDQNGGVVLLVDACDQIDVIGDNDYYVINESKEIAGALVTEIRTYLEQNGVSVSTEIIPFVCGAFDNPENPPAKVAEEAGEKVDEVCKPYCVADEFKNDPGYLNALTSLSTYVFERGMITIMEDYARKKKKLDEFKRPAFIVEDDQFRGAIDIIKARTNASSLLYVGLKGIKVSGGKKFGQGLLSFTVGMATAVATAGLGTGYYLAFMPGGDNDYKYAIAGLANLETKELTWRTWTTKACNPLKTKCASNPKEIERLLKDLVFDKEPITETK